MAPRPRSRGDNRSTPEYRTFSFIVLGTPTSPPPGVQSRIVWGSINADGTVAGGSGFWVGHQAPGMYVITFPSFQKPPAIVGSQTRSGNFNEDSRDGMVFPWVNVNYAIAITGDASGKQQDRSFSFIAIAQP